MESLLSINFSLDSKDVIDHIDLNPMNNHVSNLRIVSHKINLQNTNSKGYSFDKSQNKWVAYITIDDKKQKKRFETEDEAKQWRKEMMLINYPI